MATLSLPPKLREYATPFALTWALTCESAEACAGVEIIPYPEEQRFLLRALPALFRAVTESTMVWHTVLPRLHLGETRDPVFSDNLWGGNPPLEAFWIEMLLDVWSGDVLCECVPATAESFLPHWCLHVREYQLAKVSCSRDLIDRLGIAVETVRELAIVKRLDERFGHRVPTFSNEDVTTILAEMQRQTAARGSLEKLYRRWCNLAPLAKEAAEALDQLDQEANTLFRLLFVPRNVVLVRGANRHFWRLDSVAQNN